MNRSSLTVKLLLSIAIAMSASSRAADLSADQQLADRLETLGVGGRYAGSASDLHGETYRFADGTKGLSVSIQYSIVMPDPPRPGLPDDDYLGWAARCGSTAIVVATARDAHGLLATSKRRIFTKSTYRVDTVVSPAAGIESGTEVVVVRPGGDVVDDGEALRESFNGEHPPTLGARYLLELRALAGDASGSVFLARVSPFDRSSPVRLTYGFERSTLDALTADLARIGAALPCPNVR